MKKRTKVVELKETRDVSFPTPSRSANMKIKVNIRVELLHYYCRRCEETGRRWDSIMNCRNGRSRMVVGMSVHKKGVEDGWHMFKWNEHNKICMFVVRMGITGCGNVWRNLKISIIYGRFLFLLPTWFTADFSSCL